ncbi:MAG: hypothetical protein FJX47_00340 [Alphaproteobacteria bacterium]|nr:hypothetical protein [Alphaproteobacteria bacterium]
MTDVTAASRRNSDTQHAPIGVRHLVAVAVWLLTALLAVPVILGGAVQSPMGRALVILILVGMAASVQIILRPSAEKARKA